MRYRWRHVITCGNLADVGNDRKGYKKVSNNRRKHEGTVGTADMLSSVISTVNTRQSVNVND